MSTRPVVRAARPWTFPTGSTSHLSCGADLMTFHMPGQHVLSVEVVSPLPLDGEPRDLEGVTAMMARTLDEGAGEHDAEEMVELLERSGASMSAAAGERGLSVDMDVSASRFADALGLLVDMITRPRFGEAEVARQVRTRLAEIDQEDADPGSRAVRQFAATYYADDCRASRPTSGTRDTVRALTPEALRARHALLGPRGSTIVVAGDLRGIDVEGIVDRAFAPWGGSGEADVTDVAMGPAPARRADDAARIVVVDRPGRVQTEIHLGSAGPDRRVEGGWAPYPVLAYLIGGSPQARLDAVLREDKGYTYGMRSYARPRAGSGLFMTSGSVRSEVTQEALRLVLEILDRAADGFTAEETTAGVDFLSLTAPGRFATAEAVAGEAASRALDGLGTAHTTQVLADTLTLTPERLTRAYRDHVDDARTVVLVGDAATLTPGLDTFGMPVDVVS